MRGFTLSPVTILDDFWVCNGVNIVRVSGSNDRLMKIYNLVAAVHCLWEQQFPHGHLVLNAWTMNHGSQLGLEHIHWLAESVVPQESQDLLLLFSLASVQIVMFHQMQKVIATLPLIQWCASLADMLNE